MRYGRLDGLSQHDARLSGRRAGDHREIAQMISRRTACGPDHVVTPRLYRHRLMPCGRETEPFVSQDWREVAPPAVPPGRPCGRSCPIDPDYPDPSHKPPVGRSPKHVSTRHFAAAGDHVTMAQVQCLTAPDDRCLRNGSSCGNSSASAASNTGSRAVRAAVAQG